MIKFKSILRFKRQQFPIVSPILALAIAGLSLAIFANDLASETLSIQNKSTLQSSQAIEREYLELGFPDPGRIWSGTDLNRAAEILTSLSQEDFNKLPRYNSESGEIFARLIDRKNLNLSRNKSLPLEQRLSDLIAQMEATATMLQLYLTAQNRGINSTNEMVELMGSMLRISEVVLQVSDEALLSLDPSDPTYSSRMEGFEKVKSGITTIVAGGVTTLSENHIYQVPELKRMSLHLEQTLPQILPHLSEASRTETLVRLRSYNSDPKMQNLKPELTQLLSTVRAISQS